MALAVRGRAMSLGKLSVEVSRGRGSINKGAEGHRWEFALALALALALASALRSGSRNVTDRRLRGANGGSNEEACTVLDDEGGTALSEIGKVKSLGQPSKVGDSICGGDGEGVP